MKRASRGILEFAVVVAAGVTFAADPNAFFKEWPQGASPKEIGERVANRFLEKMPWQYLTPKQKVIIYPIVCTWYGSLEFAKAEGNKKLVQKLAKNFEPFFGERKNLVPQPVHVDFNVFAAVPLELFLQTKDSRSLQLGQSLADAQWSAPVSGSEQDTPEARDWVKQGYTFQTRLWVDDMFMITMVQAQAYRATGDRKYIDRAAKEMNLYLDRIQRPNGLFHHAPDVPFFWGRGNGWMAVGMAELLLSLPRDSEYRPRIMDGYTKMMATLLQSQRPDGMWAQLIGDPEAWPETSGTGMFTFSMVTGVKQGWLDAETYGPAARKAWLALVTYLEPNADIRSVCVGTNKKNDHQYYLDRPRCTGDLHGQAPVLWSATALLR